VTGSLATVLWLIALRKNSACNFLGFCEGGNFCHANRIVRVAGGSDPDANVASHVAISPHDSMSNDHAVLRFSPRVAKQFFKSIGFEEI
jgi:hypothetical protein